MISKKEQYSYINCVEEAFYQHKADMKCVVERTSENILAKAKKVDAAKIKKVIKYLSDQLGPAWYQELSSNQIAAANSIFTAVSDDLEKCQIERCNHVLRAIGIHPIPKKFDLTSAIRFSRNNDIAFLWFLYESVYCTGSDFESKKEYSLNERLILSCICHLDMMTTLRELNRILPKPKGTKIKLKCTPPAKRPKAMKYASPYDEPVPKPKLQSKRSFAPPARQQPKFEIYQKYKDPFYIIENETNRWFASDALMQNESRKIATGVITDQIEKMFTQDFDREKIIDSLCFQHREESTKLYQFLKSAIENRNESESIMCDDDSLNDYDPFERGVIYGIQLELAKTEKEFKDLAEKYQKQVIVKTLLHQIIENAANLKFIHLCERCEHCVQARELYCNILKNNQHDEQHWNEQSHVDLDKQVEFETLKLSNAVKFFHRPTPNGAFTFDYEKIFATNFLNDADIVCNSINRALELDKHLTVDNAITVCLKDMWQLELKLWNEKCQAAAIENAERVVADCDKIGKSKVKIFKLLKRAIVIMHNNPKFVLASLPDAHRLPILREWTLQRFGFRYTKKDNEERLKLNKYHRDHLEIVGLVPTIDVPTGNKLFGIKSTHVLIDVAAKHIPRREKWLKNYYHDLALGAIERNRLYWRTMEPFMCDTEAMRRIFYDYMPPRERDFDPIIMSEFKV